MQCGVKRKHCPSLEHINLERQQQSLFDLSILKLQQEQLRHGVEPRLLRFVLINNALRALQGHMFIFGDDDEFSFDPASTSSNRCGGGAGAGGEGTTESFLSNTFRDGGLPTTPASPPTPVKVTKMETTLSDQSPLVSSTPFQSFIAENGCTTSGGGDDDERDGVRSVMVATPPPGLTPPTPAEGMEGVTATCSSGEGKKEVGELERRLGGEVLPVTMTTVEERPDDFSTTIVDSSCTCGSRVSLGKRSREQNSDDHPCQCGMDRIGDSVQTESPCVCEDKGDNIIEEGECASPSKKLCNRPAALSLNGTKRLNGSVNGLNGLNSVYTVLGLDQIPTSSSNNSTSTSPPSSNVPTSCSPSSQSAAHSPSCSSEELDEDSSTPSPIDFTKVDPTLYDYDTRAPLFIPTQDPPPTSPPSPPPPPPPPPADADDSACHNGDHHVSNGCGGGGSVPSTTSPDSSSAPPSSSSLPPSCSSASSSSSLTSSSSAVVPPLAPPTADEAPCSASDSAVTSPTLAITATSTTFSLPPPSSEYPLISSSSSLSESCSPSSIVDSSLIDCPSDGKRSSSPSSCSLEGLVSAQNGGKVHHNHSKSERTDSESAISNGIKGGVPSSPEGAENDFLEDIEHIVSLLMT